MLYWVRLCVGYACIQQPNHTPTWSPGKTMAAQTIRTQTVLGESGNFSVLTKGKWDEGGAIHAEWLIFLFGLRFDENSCFQLILNSVHNFNFVKYFCFFKAVEYFLLISEWRKSLLPHQMVQVLSLKNLWSFSLKLYPRDITNWGKKKISLEDRRFKSSPYFMHFIASEFIQNSPEVGEWVGNVAGLHFIWNKWFLKSRVVQIAKSKFGKSTGSSPISYKWVGKSQGILDEHCHCETSSQSSLPPTISSK